MRTTPVEILQQYFENELKNPFFRHHFSQKQLSELKFLLDGLKMTESELMIDFAKHIFRHYRSEIRTLLFANDFEIDYGTGISWADALKKFKTND